jgi:hypothetical protein
MSTLVHDSIVQPISVRPDIAPAIGFWVERPIDSAYSVSAGLTTAWSRLARHEAGTTLEVITVSTWTPNVALSRTVYQNIRIYTRAGAIIYRADRTASNLFRNGSSPMPMLGFGATLDRELGNGLRLTLDLGYDIHRFSTPSLRDAGFRGERAVHRVGLSIGVSRGT